MEPLPLNESVEELVVRIVGHPHSLKIPGSQSEGCVAIFLVVVGEKSLGLKSSLGNIENSAGRVLVTIKTSQH